MNCANWNRNSGNCLITNVIKLNVGILRHCVHRQKLFSNLCPRWCHQWSFFRKIQREYEIRIRINRCSDSQHFRKYILSIKLKIIKESDLFVNLDALIVLGIGILGEWQSCGVFLNSNQISIFKYKHIQNLDMGYFSGI